MACRRLDLLAAEREVGVDDLLHLLLDLGQFLDGEPGRQLEVVEEAVLDHRADGVLHVLAVEVAQAPGPARGRCCGA